MNGKLRNSPVTYALGMFAMMVPSQAFGAYYSYYYVEKLGLALGLATLARTIYLIWDAANQPLFGYLSDRTRTRWGRRKPWIYAAMPLFMAFFVMVFAVPEGWRGTSLFVWLLVALVLYEAAATVLWVNYGALFPELFRGDADRAKASAIQQGFQMVAILIGSALAPVLFAALGFGKMALVFAGVFAVFMFVCARSVREREEALAEPPPPFLESFRATLQNKPFWVFNVANYFAQTVNGLLGAMIPFYAKYALGIPESQVSVLMASVFFSVVPLVAVWYRIVRAFGAAAAWRAALAVYGLSVIPLWFASDLAGGIAAGIVAGFGLAGFLVTPAVLTGQIIDRDFEQTGRRREGIYTAVAGFITRSSGLIAAVAFWAAGLAFGYVSGDNPGPNPEGTFRFLISAVPLGLLAISFLISLLFRMELKTGSGSGQNGLTGERKWKNF
jgi:GPH family glycoside/pentoside/hexuronide:cation symporter